MTSADLTPHEDMPEGNEPAQQGDTQNVPRQATDPFAPDGMPLALLEFHSPTAALVNMPATPSAQYIVWIIGSLFLASLAAMALFPINRVVTTPGRLISTQPTIVVQPLEMSIVRSIDAHVGDYVHKGQILAHLDPTVTEADVENMRLQSESYQAEVDRLKAEADGKEYKPDLSVPASVRQGEAFLRRRSDYQARLQNFDQRLSSLESDLQGARANAAMFASKLRVVSEVLKMRKREQQEQVGSRLSTLGAQNDLMDTERSMISAQQAANSTENKLQALHAERDAFIQNWQAQVLAALTQAQHHLDEARSDYSKAKLRQNLVLLRAPEDGIVLTVDQVSVGSILQPADKFMTLVPTGFGLEMEATMRAQDAGFVKLGDHALLKFSTFPYDQYGGAEATVRVISADSFTPSEAMSSGIRAGVDPAALAQAGGRGLFYRVRLRIDRYTLHGQPSFFHPTPGMVVRADIDVGKRTIMQYFFNRIMPALRNGMREP